jgi:molybdopterin/thiamine biosynthesis adenylyltransferase
MPDGSGAIDGSMSGLARAAGGVGDWLSALGGSAASLTQRDLERYPERSFVAGWRVEVEVNGGAHRLDLLLPPGFPWQPPRVALVDPPPFLTWPHVEVDALLCLAPNTLTIDPDDPAGVVAVTLQSARELIGHLLKDDFGPEFRDEFLTYWSFAAHKNGPSIASLVRAAPPTRAIHVWRGSNAYVLGESPEQLRAWLPNVFGGKADGYKIHEAPFLWIDTPLVPSEYPTTGHDLRALAARADGGSQLLANIARETPDKIVAMMGFQTANGPALAAAVVAAPVAPKHGARDPLLKGYRPGTVPEDILMARYFGGGKLMRRPVERADAEWVHGRGQDPRSAVLRQATVIVIGCGSVGAPIAIALAQAGIGSLVLVDFESLTWANVGRHPLGAAAVGRNKAKSLAQKLRSDFPHLTVQHHEVDVDTMVRKHADVLESSNLIVSATGSWAGDGRLETWRVETDHRAPVVYAWTEAHACAGHAVRVGRDGGCLRCGFDRTGLPNFQVTAWPNGSLRTEPACGAIYQPYGPVELGFINSLAAELSLEAVLGETIAPAHRVWVAPAGRLSRLGGTWAETWQRDPAFRNEGGFVLERTWPAAACPGCKVALAA